MPILYFIFIHIFFEEGGHISYISCVNPLGIFGCYDVRVTSESDVGFWLDFGSIMMLDFGWILVGFGKKNRSLFKVENLKSNFQRSINVRFSMLYQRQLFNVG